MLRGGVREARRGDLDFWVESRGRTDLIHGSMSNEHLRNTNELWHT